MSAEKFIHKVLLVHWPSNTESIRANSLEKLLNKEGQLGWKVAAISRNDLRDNLLVILSRVEKESAK